MPGALPGSDDHADDRPPLPSGTGDGTGPETPDAGLPVETESCGTRDDMDLRMGEMDDRYGEFRESILGVNDDLPLYRNDVRDIDKVCTPKVESSISSAIKKLERLDIEADSDLAVDLIVCVDRLRRETDEEFNAPGITTIRMQRLSDELHRLTDTTHRVQNVERALRRAVSKRHRLVEEMKQLVQEIAIACQ